MTNSKPDLYNDLDFYNDSTYDINKQLDLSWLSRQSIKAPGFQIHRKSGYKNLNLIKSDYTYSITAKSIALTYAMLILLAPSYAAESKNTYYNPAERITAPQDNSVEKIDDLTGEVLLKLIELQKFNMHYTLEVAKQGRWKGWRYSLLQETNTSLNLAGGIISTANRGANLKHAERVKLYPQEAANYIPMIGSIIGASAAATEFGINSYHDIAAGKQGYSPKKSIERVKTLKIEIESLMNMRQELIEDESKRKDLHKQFQIHQAESLILQDTLAQSLQEFARFHVGARKLLAFQQMQYFFDASKFTTSAIGSHFAYLSLSRRHRVWNGRAGVMYAVSGQLTMWGPVLSRLFAKQIEKVSKNKTKFSLGDFDDENIETLRTDLKLLDSMIKSNSGSDDPIDKATERQALFDSHEQCFTSEIENQKMKEAKSKLTATQNIAAGMFVGGCKTASAVLFLVPGFNRSYNGKTERAGHVTNDLLFASAVVGLPAGTLSMLDTLRIQVQGELDRRRAIAAGEHPAQIAIRRLKELESMEESLIKQSDRNNSRHE